MVLHSKGFPGSSAVKNPLSIQERHRSHGSDPWVRKIPWRREQQPTPVFLPGESHGQMSLWATVHGVAKGQRQLSNLAQALHNKKEHFTLF